MFVSFCSELAEFLVQICAVSEVYFCIREYWIQLKITRSANIDVTWLNKTSLDHKFFAYYSSVCDIFVRFEFTGLLGSFYSQVSPFTAANVTKFAEHGFSVDWFSTSHMYMHFFLIQLDDQHTSHWYVLLYCMFVMLY